MKDNTFKAFLLVATCTFASSCSLMLPDRSFIEQMEREEQSFYSPGKDFPVVSGDTGDMRRSREEVMARTPASARSQRLNKEMVSISEELSRKEADLDEWEMEKYASQKKFLQSDSDKLYYLNLESQEREAYIRTKKTDLEDELRQKTHMVQRHSIHSSELFLGMNKNEVVGAWGKPARVEIAGNPSSQNERWSFVEDGNVRQVYFEGGKVQGWALDL